MPLPQEGHVASGAPEGRGRRVERLHQRVVKPLHDFEHLRQKKMIGFPWLGLLSSCFISVVIAGFIFYKYGLGSKEAEMPLQSQTLCCSGYYHDKQALNLSWLSIKSVAAVHGF